MSKKATIILVSLIAAMAVSCFVVQQAFGVAFMGNVDMQASSVGDRKIELNGAAITGLGWGGASDSAVPAALVDQNVDAVSWLTEEYITGLFDDFKTAVVDTFANGLTITYRGSTYNLGQIEGLINNHDTLISNLTGGISSWENTKGIYGRGSGSTNRFALWSDFKTLTYDSEFYVSSGNRIIINKNVSTPKLDISNNGDLYVSGNKFKIDHPTQKGKKLVHSVLEGPEAVVFYRGEGQLVNGEAVVELPEYFEALTRKEGRTVFLTPVTDSAGGPVSDLAASYVKDGRFRVRALGNNPSQKFYWQVDALRADVWPLEVEREKENK